MLTLQSENGGGSIRLLVALAAVGLLAFQAYQRAALYLARRRFKKAHGCLPAQKRIPARDPFFSSDRIVANMRAAKEKRYLEGTKQRMHSHGPTMAGRMWTRYQIQTMDPDNVKAVLSLKFHDYGFGNRGPMIDVLGLGIFTTDGERWASSRHMIRPNFAREQVADLAAFERHFQALLAKLPRDDDDNDDDDGKTTVDLQDLFFRLTMDSATEFLFGESVHSLRHSDDDDDDGFSWAFNYALRDATRRFRLGPLKRFAADPKAADAIRIVHAFVDKFVDDAVRYRDAVRQGREDGKEDKYVFLHELAKATGDKRRLRDELLNVLLAGRDTTASLLSNMFFVIAKRPDVYAKLRAEVAQLDGRLPTYEELRNLKYLKYCINESLRLHPVVPGNSRQAINDTVLPHGGGLDGQSPLFVPKGAIVMYSPYSMHRRTDFFGPDADEFRPERWESLRPGWEYLPFNGGPRICLGQQYALTEASYVTLRIVQEFAKLESRDPGPWLENLALTLCSFNGTKVGLWPDRRRRRRE